MDFFNWRKIALQCLHVVLVSAIQQCESVIIIYIYIYPLPQVPPSPDLDPLGQHRVTGCPGHPVDTEDFCHIRKVSIMSWDHQGSISYNSIQ